MAAAPEPALDAATIQAVARQVAAILGDTDGSLLTAAQVAARFNVERSWVYAHAEELGVVRLGAGRRPRLRFDAALIAQRLVASPGRVPSDRRSSRIQADVPLLPIKRTRRRRLERQ